MDQLSIFDIPEEVVDEPVLEDSNHFQSEKAHWHQQSSLAVHMPGQSLCKVIGIIPEYVKSPTEEKTRGDYPTQEYGEMLDIWSAYVWGIAQTIPYEDRAEKDANGWEQAMQMLAESRDEKKPILLHIWDYRQKNFMDLEVVEYLPES